MKDKMMWRTLLRLCSVMTVFFLLLLSGLQTVAAGGQPVQVSPAANVMSSPLLFHNSTAWQSLDIPDLDLAQKSKLMQTATYTSYLPIITISATLQATPPPRTSAVVGYTGTPAEDSISQTVRFPSVRKNDRGWTSSFAIQNSASSATTLTLQFFREDGGLAYTTNDIPLQPYGTYLASLAHFPLTKGSYALIVTATEPIVGMVSTQHAAGAMAMAYKGAGQGGHQVLIPQVWKGFLGWQSRLCLHNSMAQIGQVMITYYGQGSTTPVASRQIALPANGSHCIELSQEPLLPSPFGGAAVITTENVNIVATVENVQSQENQALSYRAFDLLNGSDTLYIPRCRQENNWQTGLLVAEVNLSVTKPLTVSYHEFDGSIGYTEIYPGVAPGGLWAGLQCPDSVSLIPPPVPYRLGSAVISVGEGELVALVADRYSSGSDSYSYPASAISSTLVYALNVGIGLENWSSSLSIQNLNSITNTTVTSFYNQVGDRVYEHVENLPPYGMKEVKVNLLPSLPISYSGSAIISATNPVVVLISKEK